VESEMLFPCDEGVLHSITIPARDSFLNHISCFVFTNKELLGRVSKFDFLFKADKFGMELKKMSKSLTFPFLKNLIE